MGTIRIHNLGKAYKNYPSRKARLLEWLVPGHKPRHQQVWVLQDISFDVAAGEAVGILGINGAGKSTLLKMICGTTQPTTWTLPGGRMPSWRASCWACRRLKLPA